MTSCSMCEHENEPGARFCSSCGAAMPTTTQTTGIYDIANVVETTEVPIVNPIHFAELAGSNAVLVVTRGSLEGVRFTLTATNPESVTIGRSPESSIFLDDVTVSRQHATLTFTTQGWVLTDSGSLNGTYVNRRLVNSVVLANNDDVQIGKYRLVFIANQSQA